MDALLPGLWGPDLFDGISWLVLAGGVLAGILATGRAIGRRLQLQLWGIPEALVAGVLGLLVAPKGPFPLLPEHLMELWAQLPLVLLTLVFGSLMLGKPLPKLAGVLKPVGGHVALALVLAFGQYVVAGLVVLLVLHPLLGFSPVMACLIEVAFEGGHGAAAAMGASYAALGFESGQDLGLALATVGLLSSTLIGGLVVVLGRSRGWLVADLAPEAIQPPATPTGTRDGPGHPLAAWLCNLGLVGLAVGVGWILQLLLRQLTGWIGGGVATVGQALPVFPLAILGSLLVRWLLQRSGRSQWASATIQSEVSTLAADLLIASATAGLNLELLQANWLPISLLAGAGLAWNLLISLWLAPKLLPKDWFERALVEFGQATGVAASGLLLLRMADPEAHSDALPAFSLKQLLLQPLLSGGVITVVAPLAVAGWGLPLWTLVCAGVMLLAAGAGLWIAQLQELEEAR